MYTVIIHQYARTDNYGDVIDHGSFEIEQRESEEDMKDLVKKYLLENTDESSYSHSYDIYVINGSIIFDDSFIIDEYSDLELTKDLKEFYTEAKNKKEKMKERSRKREEAKILKIEKSQRKLTYLKLKEEFDK